jgi:hypothetical protein
MTIFALVYLVVVAAWIALMIVGHVLLGHAIYLCLRNERPVGQADKTGTVAAADVPSNLGWTVDPSTT